MAKPTPKKYSIPRPYQAVGAFLRASREAADLTQLAVAKKLGYLTPQLISNFEAGITMPPLKKIAQMVDLYRIDPNEL